MTNNGQTAVKEFNEGNAADSVQFRSYGDPPLFGQPLLMEGFAFRIATEADELPVWWCRERDRFLRTRLHGNTIVSGIVYGEATRVKNMPYTLTHEDDDQDELAKWQQKLQLADFGTGLPTFLSKIATDYLTQDNGSFFEILGDGVTEYVDETFYRRVMEGGRETQIPYKTRFLAKGERTGEAKGIAYLDAGQCWRTMNPEFPVIYTNPYTGQMTVLHWTRVSYQSQFTQGYELGRGLGLCALSRTYEMVRLLKSVNLYYFEKITGQSPEIYVANQPVSKMDQAITGGVFNRDNKGFQVFSDPVMIAPKSGGVGAQELKISKVGLRDVPDGFSYKEQVDIAVQALALGFGVDVREIWAMMASGATKADAEIQDIKTTGKGRADILSYIENEINWRILPPEITFTFDEVDDLSDKRKAEIKQIRVNTRATQIQSGELSLQEAREMAAEVDDILPEFLERVATADEMTSVEAVNPTDEDLAPKEAPGEDVAEELEDEKALRLLAENDLGESLSCAILLNLANNADLITVANRIKRNSKSDYEWESPSDYHVTLVFLKSIAPEKIIDLTREFNGLVPPKTPLHIGKVGYFNNENENSLHFAVDSDPELADYQRKLYEIASQYGEVSEYSDPEKWTPHITIAYSDDPIEKPGLLKRALNIEHYGAFMSISVNDEYAVVYAVKKNDEIGQKAYSQTRALFFSNLVSFCELAVSGQLSSRNFMSSLKGELRIAGRAAFLDGIKNGAGNYSFGESELSPDEIVLRNGLIETQISYAGNLRDFAYADPPPSFIEIISRVALWSKKGLDGIYASGKLAGAKNKPQEWFYGDTIKHCPTCSAAKGQVHRAKTWMKYGIIPRADKLHCKGFECDCELRDTTKPISGRIDRIPLKDGKHIHADDDVPSAKPIDSFTVKVKAVRVEKVKATKPLHDYDE